MAAAATAIHCWTPKIPDEWILQVDVLGTSNDSFIASSSSGRLREYLVNKLSDSYINEINAHESSINDTTIINDKLMATCSTDGIKVWDLRSNEMVKIYNNDKKSSFLSITSLNNYIAGGTELIGNDSELHIWDLRKHQEPIKSYKDSHHDDITDIKFHPHKHQYLMSGSTDGYVNIYDLNEVEEDDSLHQVINYASVHSCNFISDDRISILSHMETLSFNQLNNTDYETMIEPQPKDFQDVRSLWEGCEYVVDLNPSGYITYGANSSHQLSLLPFNPMTESFGAQVINFPNGHGEEVVRDVKVLSNGKSALTCGEDGNINLWQLPYQLSLYDHMTLTNDGSIDRVNKDATGKQQDKSHGSKSKDRSKHKSNKSKKARYKPY